MAEREKFPGYGPCLSGPEYDRKITSLYRHAAERPGNRDAIEKELEAGEFFLLIDHRLGTKFPVNKRQALLAAKQRIGEKRMKLVYDYLLASIRKRRFATGMQFLFERMSAEFAKILTAEELDALLDRENGKTPVLPLDTDKL